MKRAALIVVVAIALLGVQASSAVSVGGETDAMRVTGAEGPLVLEAGDVHGISAAEDELLIDTARGSAGGVAPDARYVYGDVADPTGQPAFTLTNTDDAEHRLTLAFTGSDAEDADANVRFQLYDADGRHLVTVSEESGSVGIDLAAHERVFVVVVIDTHGLTPASDLSGSLTMTMA